MKTKRLLLVISVIFLLSLACQTVTQPFANGEDDLPTEASELLIQPTIAVSSTDEFEIESPEVPDVETVLVPEGEFMMGSNSGYPDERPEHTVYLDSFLIDKYETTNKQYQVCVDLGICDALTDTGLRERDVYNGNPEFDNYPVVNVDWNMANTYCEWRGGQLPSEAQWEKAARGTDGSTYPWGEGIDNTYANYNVNLGNTTPVGNYENGVSQYGAYDMAGNVEEWVADWYSESYYQISPSSNPLGPDESDRKVSRGGSWAADYDFSRTTFRFKGSASFSGVTLGLRCATTP